MLYMYFNAVLTRLRTSLYALFSLLQDVLIFELFDIRFEKKLKQAFHFYMIYLHHSLFIIHSIYMINSNRVPNQDKQFSCFQ